MAQMTSNAETQNDRKRNESIGFAMVPLKSMDRVVDALEGMYRLHGTRHQGQICAIVGPTHTGKSIAQKVFMAKKAKELGGYVENIDPKKELLSEVANVSYVTVPEGPTLTHPVMRIQIMDNPTFVALADNTLRALVRGTPPKWKNGGDLASLLQQQLSRKKTKLVIYDDIQELGKVRGGAKNQAVQMLKSLCKVARVEVAAAGVEGSLDVLTSNQETAELINKRIILRPLSPPLWEDGVGSGEFLQFLTDLKERLPFTGQSPIDSKELADPLWRYSEGLIGSVKAILQSATDFAIQKNLNAVDRHVLRYVLSNEFDVEESKNEFFLKGDRWDHFA